ncbi:MAG: bifunctional folylpolyglutamate synthase/dihydrofolate synthase [Prevotella sp.]|nr:bifunctional folylpolyglutamate synthase/dihydrofolate synthase [Prevotella sp.]MBO5156707.1 bifunctional folylpolyglutamate synthase/dihydrofolate synthase [Prevotella sp.]
MSYTETCEYLFNQMPMFERQGASGYKEGLANTKALDEHFNHPHKNYKTIHIAGTNGKGSCSHSIAAILQTAGYRVGLYTSPHLVDFSERIRVNGEPISEDYVIDFVERERHFFEPLHPSFFEVTTALAFKYFSDMKVDVAVIEVGLGGRLDCTNIISPILSVITNISFDHTQFLGNTLAKIAGEKAGIIKKGTRVIIGEVTPETRPVFEAKAKEMDAPICFAEDNPYMNAADMMTDLKGIYQQKNANTILTAMTNMPELKITDEDIRRGLANVCTLTGLKGRWQTLEQHPLTICDTGHNVAGWKYLSKQISRQPCDTLHIVFGMVDDKDVDAVMDILPQSAIYYFTKAETHRAINEQILKEKAEAKGLFGNTYPTVSQAYNAAKSNARENDFVFIGGSSYVVADLLKNCF